MNNTLYVNPSRHGCLQNANGGEQFGCWTVLYKSDRKLFKHILYMCRCECGTEKLVIKQQLINGTSKSCGCKKKTLGGLSMLPEYDVWCSMISRCNDPKNKGWKNYGGRGITVCSEWQGESGFKQFLNDMGPRPNGRYSIDRSENDKGYNKQNCHWKTSSEQNSNKRTVDNLSWIPTDILIAEGKRRELI